MRNVVFIGREGCNPCHYLMETVVQPLIDDYPDNVSAHYGWDRKIAKVNERKKITHIPLFVIERDGVEEFRCSGRLTYDQLADIIECDSLTVEEVLGAERR